MLPVHVDDIVLVDAADKIHARGEQIGARPADKRQALIAPDFRSDAGIEAHGADVDGVILPVAADEVECGLLGVEQAGQGAEGRRI